jgi:glycosyltransferase involved in cell wall biosynthesis
MGQIMAETLALNSVSETGSTAKANASSLISVVVVGQVPPPMNGQSLMIQEFLNGDYPGLRLEHVPMTFSRSTAEIGSFGLRKLGVLFETLAWIVWARFTSKATILYYPPAGANLVPILRDLFLLIPARRLFRHTVFHFHAAGLHDIYSQLPLLLRPLFRLAYENADLAIFTTELTSAQGISLKARATAIVPCGISDDGATLDVEAARTADPPTILFAGILCEGKGVMTLLQACRILRDQGMRFRAVCLGAFQGADFQEDVEDFVRREKLEDYVGFPGVVTGEAKSNAFASASIFCFPSHYAAESFGVVLIEAMSFSLPIVATEWQGIPEVTGTGGGSLLVPIKDSVALALALRRLLLAPDQRRAMGKLNRERFLSRFTVARYRESLHRSLLRVGEGARQERKKSLAIGVD